MTQYIIQNDNEEFMAAYNRNRVSWTKSPECAKTFLTREAAKATLRKVEYLCHCGPCWVAKVVRD